MAVTAKIEENFKKIVNELRQPVSTKENIDTWLDEIANKINTISLDTLQNQKGVRALNSKVKFFSLMVYYPSIWLKIMLTLVFWVTLEEVVISPTIKQLFVDVNMDQNRDLQIKHFVSNKHVGDRQALQNAEYWYNDLIFPLATSSKPTLEKIQQAKALLKEMETTCNKFLANPDGTNNDVGSKARAACEASARGTTLFHYLKLMGCLSGLVAPGAECDAIKEALKNLIESAEDLDL